MHRKCRIPVLNRDKMHLFYLSTIITYPSGITINRITIFYLTTIPVGHMWLRAIGVSCTIHCTPIAELPHWLQLQLEPQRRTKRKLRQVQWQNRKCYYIYTYTIIYCRYPVFNVSLILQSKVVVVVCQAGNFAASALPFLNGIVG